MKTTDNTEMRRAVVIPGAGVSVREAGEGNAPSRTIAGYAILFGVPSAPLYEDEEETVREVIAPGAITKELLDGCDIKFTMYHDRQLILGRSRLGEGTLHYTVDERGVAFELNLPASPNGDEALELVRRGDLSGCSFAFSAHYGDCSCVDVDVKRDGGHTETTYTVRKITAVYDFTLAADPAYPATSVEARAMAEAVRSRAAMAADEAPASNAAQLSAMRSEASKPIF